MNLAHRIRLPGSEELNGFSEVQRRAPSDVRRTLYFRLFGKSTNWKFSTFPLPGRAVFLTSPPDTFS